MSISHSTHPHQRNDRSAPSRRISVIWPLLLIAGVLFGGVWWSAPYWNVERGPSIADSTLLHTITRGDLVVSVVEQGTLESSDNTELKCKVRGFSTVTWVVKVGTFVEKGQELVRLDTKSIEESVSLQKTNAFTAMATLEQSRANVAKAKIALEAYEKGTYPAQLEKLEQAAKIAEMRLKEIVSENLRRSELLYSRGFINPYELEADTAAVNQAMLELKVKKNQINVLKTYTRNMELATLKGNIAASQSKFESDQEGLKTDELRRDRAMEELKECVIVAPRDGLVIYPSAAEWKATPDIAEGATVRHDQVLLFMPNLEKMQIKVGVHESIVDQVTVGKPATVKLSDRTLHANVTTVANVTRPAGWWTGNVVKYDTIIELPTEEGLKPGMSAEVEIILSSYEDEVLIPVAAVVETRKGSFCWVQSDQGVQQRQLELGESNDVFIVVQSGLQKGEQVVLNPLSLLDEAQDQVQDDLN